MDTNVSTTYTLKIGTPQVLNHSQYQLKHFDIYSLYTSISTSSLAKVLICFPPLPLGGFRQVFKLSANIRLASFASYYAGIGITGDVQIRFNISTEHRFGI